MRRIYKARALSLRGSVLCYEIRFILIDEHILQYVAGRRRTAFVKIGLAVRVGIERTVFIDKAYRAIITAHIALDKDIRAAFIRPVNRDGEHYGCLGFTVSCYDEFYFVRAGLDRGKFQIIGHAFKLSVDIPVAAAYLGVVAFCGKFHGIPGSHFHIIGN